MITYADRSSAINAIRDFYAQYQNTPGRTLNYKIGSLSVELIAKINQVAKLELGMGEGEQSAYEVLKSIANQLHSSNVPIASLFYSKLKIPVSFFEVRQAYKLSSSVPQITTRDVKGRNFLGRYVVKDNVKLNAENCTFSNMLIANSDIALKGCVAVHVHSRSGSVIATDSKIGLIDIRDGEGDVTLSDTYAEDVWTHGGVKWINLNNFVLFEGKPVDDVDAREFIEVQGVCATNVVSSMDGLKAINSKLTTVSVVGLVTLEDSTVEKLSLNLPKIPRCRIDIKNSHIKELIFHDSPATISSAKSEPYSVCGYPESFNYPTNDLKGSLSSDGSGRIEGIPYQLVGGKYVEGIHIEIVGSGTIEGITFKNCKEQPLSIPDTIKLGPV